MIEEPLRVLILKNYVRRILTWLLNFGIVFALVGASLLYDHFGFWDPLRYRFDEPLLQFWTITAISVTVGCVAAAAIIGLLLINRGISVKIEPGTGEKSESELKQAVIFAVASKISALESALWLLAGLPAVIGAILFAFGRSSHILFLYLSISMLTAVIFFPSLEITERIIERCLKQCLPAMQHIDTK